ncbi:hypothetical protein E2542_SST01522 [Spatholobus suberectus]|nr:hypothetical protein E2542_SST01522 [Spatholobus suberectus]
MSQFWRRPFPPSVPSRLTTFSGFRIQKPNSERKESPVNKKASAYFQGKSFTHAFGASSVKYCYMSEQIFCR